MDSANHRFWMGEKMATGLVELSRDPAVLDDGNFWAVSTTFEGEFTFARFKNITLESFANEVNDAEKSTNALWQSDMNKEEYCSYVEEIREAIADGHVYQVNACRQISRTGVSGSLSPLFEKILKENPAPFSSYLSLPGIEIASASPELFIMRAGNALTSSPIKGTKELNSGEFGEKDKSENVMIVDLMRNDLGQVCVPGSVDVSDLLRTEDHPGLSHLVSDVIGTLKSGVTWNEIWRALLPAGSISGAPKSSAIKLIKRKERTPRGPYCGVLGWVHGDQAVLSVAIRIFWKKEDDVLRFGTGAGITWGSDPEEEWHETELKARKLIAIAEGA